MHSNLTTLSLALALALTAQQTLAAQGVKHDVPAGGLILAANENAASRVPSEQAKQDKKLQTTTMPTTPAIPATPAVPGGPGTPAIPAIPATPATPGSGHDHGTASRS